MAPYVALPSLGCILSIWKKMVLWTSLALMKIVSCFEVAHVWLIIFCIRIFLLFAWMGTIWWFFVICEGILFPCLAPLHPHCESFEHSSLVITFLSHKRHMCQHLSFFLYSFCILGSDNESLITTVALLPTKKDNVLFPYLVVVSVMPFMSGKVLVTIFV